jgi:hypothetical protein
MYNISGGQKCSYTAGMKNITGAITFLKEELELQKEAMRKAELEAEKAHSQIKALCEAFDAR